MNCFEIWQGDTLLARAPAGTFIKLPMRDGRMLHVGPDGMYFVQEVVVADNIQVKGVQI